MSVLSYLHFFNATAYFYLGVYIFIKNPKALLNRICFTFLLLFGLWSFSLVFVHNPYSSKSTAGLFVNISSVAWTSFSSFFLWFLLALSQKGTLPFFKKHDILKAKWFYVALFGIPLVFICAQWANLIFHDYSKEWYGWKPIYTTSLWPYVYIFYSALFMGTGLVINFHLMRASREIMLKKQAAIIFITSIITFTLGSFTDIILPLAGFHRIPNIADVFVLICAFGIIYAVVKYKFLTITPATAAENIISTMYDCLILLNLEGNIVTVNKATSDLSGYEQAVLTGAPVSILFPLDELNRGSVETIARDRNLKNEELVLKTKEGKKVPVLFSSSLLRDESGNPGGIVCVAKDISERKELLEEIFKSKKLESIGMLAGGIAHDFNNLLSVIMGNISLALNKIPSTEKAYKFLEKSEKASLKAAELARKFVTFSRGGWLQKEKVSLHRILQNMKQTGLPGADTAAVYDINIPPGLMPISGDEEQLTQVFQNLFLNAVEAVPRGEKGKISLQARNTTIIDEKEEQNGNRNDAQDTGKFLLKKGKEYVKIIIKDNGTGIPGEDLGKIFDPYFSKKDGIGREGMGLGLTICYSIIKKHDGHIKVESREGKGTTVTLHLPAFIKNDAPDSAA